METKLQFFIQMHIIVVSSMSKDQKVKKTAIKMAKM